MYHLLEDAANASITKVIVYPPGNLNAPVSRSYQELLTRATGNASLISRTDGVVADSKILLHLDQHSQNIEWFWSTIIAGLLPVMSPPSVNDINQQRKQLIHLHELLQDLIILTSKKLVPDCLGLNQPSIHTIESLDDGNEEQYPRTEFADVGKQRHGSAVLMLTSGSTGNAKAVNLTSRQILSSVRGKSAIHGTNSTDVFLNWIGMDHVACLIEIHLHAMSLGAEQIHVHASDLLKNPLYFLELISKHRVTYTFAPNFFLAALRRSLETADHCDFDLSCLRIIVTGGEAAVVENCSVLTQCLRRFKIPENRDVIRPGFGMTETCAGSIYGSSCPTYDMKHNLEFASLGSCMPGINMRIMGDTGATAAINEVGNLQVSGPVVFKSYYNNTQATLDSFTEDGWFITGDRAALDANGCLSLAGRLKDNIIINGIKHFPHEIETALEEAHISGATASYYVIFSHRPKLSETETYCVVYLPSYDLNDGRARTETADAIIQSCIIAVGARPYRVIPLESSQLPKTTLGKISRAKIRTAFESGLFTEAQDANDSAIRGYRNDRANCVLTKKPSTDLERRILEIFAQCFGLHAQNIGVDSSIFSFGVTSMHLIRFKRELEDHLALDTEIPLITILASPDIRRLAKALEINAAEAAYNPVVALQPHGTHAPLWLVHPGVGEVLVFLNLAKHITDRPVYALRARGFNRGEKFFESIPEIVSTYHTHIKRVQPIGPYAIAGYSFGAMLAFEITKVLERHGDEVHFLGSFNLPPHIKTRMKQLDWTEVVLNLSYFLNLITEQHAQRISSHLHSLPTHQLVLRQIMDSAPPARLAELALTAEKLSNWASLAHAMQRAAIDYEPRGTAASIDVFVANPLASVAGSKKEWYEKHLTRWEEFSRSEVKFWDVEGAHYTMINEEFVRGFQKSLKRALKERGL